MHALHSTLLPSSAIHHSLYLANFTPSTIYPPPLPPASPEIKVTGNLIVAGGTDLRIFEIREESLPIADPSPERPLKGEGEVPEEVEDGFFDTGPTERAPLRFEITRKLHLVARHSLHGTVTGLAGLRTIESSVDGLDRLLVSFKDAKMALLEWSRGDIATVSLHTYERCTQMTTGDLSSYVPRLRSDPLSRLAVLTLPDDALAVLPVLQEQTDFDVQQDNFPRDVPYSPSFVLSLSEVSSSLKNLQDLLFLPGFHSPTLALLFSPSHTWAGRYHSARDTFCIEIRTIDLSSGTSYPLLTSVTGLPSDSLYLVACPAELGGVVLVTATGVVHVDQSGRIVGAGVNAWWSYTTNLPSDRSSEGRKLTLEGSQAVFVTDRDMLLVLQDGDVHQVRFEMDGRAVGSIKVDEQSSAVPPPSSLVIAGDRAVFVGSAEGDSILAKVDVAREVLEEKPAENKDMEVDWDEDLYGDISAPTANGHTNGHAVVSYGPATIHLSPYDVLEGIGKILDMEFGIAVTDQGARTYPQLVAVSGGSKRSTFNVFRRGIPITKRRRFNELAHADAVWFLPIQRAGGQRFKGIMEEDRTTILLSSENGQTRIFALSTKATPEQIGRIGAVTIAAGAFFQRTSIAHVSPTAVVLLDQDGKLQQTICSATEVPIISASISDPYIVIRRADNTVSLLMGDSVARSVSVQAIPSNPLCQAVQVFTDETGVYRTFEARDEVANMTSARSSAIKAGQQSRMQLTVQQIKRLQEEKPAISSADTAGTESVISTSKGTQWLALLTQAGVLQIRSLSDLSLVLESDGLASSQPSFTDDLDDGIMPEPDEESDPIKQMHFLPIGARTPRPHLLVLHSSGRLNIYEALPRFTLDASTHARRSLAIRYRKVHTQLLPLTSNTRLQYNVVPFANVEGLTGAFITGEKPHWIVGSDAHGIKAFGLKQAAMAFGRTTHLGGTGEYFVRIEDGSFICYLPPTLNTDFDMPCDRYEMPRVYTNLAFDPPSGHYVGATAITVPFQAYDEEGEIQLGPQGENLIPPTNERSSLELFSQGSEPWRVIDGYDFDQNEQVLCMESVTLESPSQPSGFRDFIAVGTGFDFAEDRATRGNVYVFEVLETVPDPGQSGSGWKLRMRCKDPARNPVSALSHINGYLLHSNGPKMLVKGLDDDERLMGLAFLDINLYVTSIRVLKNLILVSDLQKSLWLVTLQEHPYKFTTISKDLQAVSLMSGDFLAQEGQVTFITNDREGEMRMLDFDPADPDSLNGEKLLLKTEYHIGAPVTCSRVIARRKTAEEEWAPQSQIVYATAEGAITTVVSVKPARFKRLQLVTDQLVRNAQHIAGLNPRAFRAVRNDLVPQALSRGILDGPLLERFAWQPVKRQREMMRQIGTDAVTVASDLQALGGFW
ncbi:cleavage and polyadenylation specific protein [Naematelia encephala]|uniref:Protein CFT1 n=1 Tax=Naematelia encephala TaxID=71784 RepID=A0A1Y2BEV4_9TREE|nr:cleavage and polyadenylation specific protein [Naematelia encephala]